MLLYKSFSDLYVTIVQPRDMNFRARITLTVSNFIIVRFACLFIRFFFIVDMASKSMICIRRSLPKGIFNQPDNLLRLTMSILFVFSLKYKSYYYCDNLIPK